MLKQESYHNDFLHAKTDSTEVMIISKPKRTSAVGTDMETANIILSVSGSEKQLMDKKNRFKQFNVVKYQKGQIKEEILQWGIEINKIA